MTFEELIHKLKKTVGIYTDEIIWGQKTFKKRPIYDDKELVLQTNPSQLIDEVPQGFINGVNTRYRLSQTPISVQTMFVFLNGTLRSGIVLDGNEFIMPFAPVTGSLQVKYFTYVDILDANTISSLQEFMNAYVASNNILTHNGHSLTKNGVFLTHTNL